MWSLKPKQSFDMTVIHFVCQDLCVFAIAIRAFSLGAWQVATCTPLHHRFVRCRSTVGDRPNKSGNNLLPFPIGNNRNWGKEGKKKDR